MNSPFPAPVSSESATISEIPGRLSIGSDMGFDGGGSVIGVCVVREVRCG